MVVILPAGWDPGTDWRQADLFGALDQPWLRLVGLPAPSTTAPRRTDLTYPARQRRAEVGPSMVRAANRAVVQAQVYADALTEPDGAVDGYTRLALQSTSYHARNNRLGAVLDAERLRAGHQRQTCAGSGSWSAGRSSPCPARPATSW